MFKAILFVAFLYVLFSPSHGRRRPLPWQSLLKVALCVALGYALA